MTSEVAVQSEPLWKLADDLQAAEETLAMVEARIIEATMGALAKPCQDGDVDVVGMAEQVIELQDLIVRISSDLVKKTDACAAVLRKFDSDDEQIKAEEKRLKVKRQSNQKAKDRLEQYIMRVMKECGVSMFKTPLNTISIRKNGGVAPLEVSQLLLPADMRIVTLTIPENKYQELMEDVGDMAWGGDYADLVKVISREQNNHSIREALKRGQEVPGARLLERGQHLEVK